MLGGRALSEETASPAASLFFNASFRSSDASADTTPPASSAGTRYSALASSFALRPEEVAFFDHVVALLPRDSSSFAELKQAYNTCFSDEELVRHVSDALRPAAADGSATVRASLDARLWNTLLALVQVRGSTWSERWDAIRVSLGYDPLGSSSESAGSSSGDEASDDEIERYEEDPADAGQLTEMSLAELMDALPASPDAASVARNEHTFRTPSPPRRQEVPLLVPSPPPEPPSPASYARELASARRPYRESSSPAGAPLAGSVWSIDTERSNEPPADLSQSLSFNALTLPGSPLARRPPPFSRFPIISPPSPPRAPRDLTRLHRAERELCLFDQADALSHWRKLLAKHAERQNHVARMHERITLLRSWQAWRSRHARLARSAQRADTWLAHRVGRSALARWREQLDAAVRAHRERQEAQLRAAYRVVDARQNHTLVALSWMIWRQAYAHRAAEATLAARATRSALRVWRRRLAQRQALNARAAQLSDFQQSALVQRTFTHWLVRTRGSRAVQGADQLRVRRAWNAWWVAYAERVAALHTLEQHVALCTAKRSVADALHAWRQRTGEHQTLLRLAGRSHERQTLLAAWQAWRARFRWCLTRAEDAETLHDVSALTSAWRTWCMRRREAAAERLLAARKHAALRGAFERWHLQYRQRYHWRTGVALLAARTAHRLESQCLQTWLQRVVERHDTEWRAQRSHDAVVRRHALCKWEAALQKVRTQADMCDLARTASDKRTWTLVLTPLTRQAADMRCSHAGAQRRAGGAACVSAPRSGTSSGRRARSGRPGSAGRMPMPRRRCGAASSPCGGFVAAHSLPRVSGTGYKLRTRYRRLRSAAQR